MFSRRTSRSQIRAAHLRPAWWGFHTYSRHCTPAPLVPQDVAERHKEGDLPAILEHRCDLGGRSGDL